MADHHLELDAFSIVVLGSFNPAIFHPLWFSSNNLIRTEEATKNVEIQVVHRNATVFSTEWFSLQVTGDRFAVETRDPGKSLLLRDLALGTFKILEHTPLTAFGLNRISQFQTSSVERWHAFGHHFAPKESWNAIMKDPGLRMLAIEGKRDGCEGKITVSIEPSVKVHPGILININEHHDLPVLETNGSPANRIALFLDGLQSSWEGFVGYSDRTSAHLFTESSKPTKKKRR
jgi:hypothetical protein